MPHILRTELELALPVDDVFAFFADAGNLERITPPELRFRIVTPQPIDLHVGTLIDYRLRLFGLPFGWRTRIARWEPPAAFVDEQVRGPYREWVHLHTFEPTPRGTRIRDEVRYRLPLWPAGEVVWPLIRLQLGRIFNHRQRVICELLGGDGVVVDPGWVQHGPAEGGTAANAVA